MEVLRIDLSSYVATLESCFWFSRPHQHGLGCLASRTGRLEAPSVFDRQSAVEHNSKLTWRWHGGPVVERSRKTQCSSCNWHANPVSGSKASWWYFTGLVYFCDQCVLAMTIFSTPWASHTLHIIQGCVAHRGTKPLVGNRLCVGLTRTIVRPLLPAPSSQLRKQATTSAWSEPPVTQTGQHPWFHLGMKTLPTRIGYCPNTKGAHRFRREDNNVLLKRVQPPITWQYVFF